jgi:hypothetical protein
MSPKKLIVLAVVGALSSLAQQAIAQDSRPPIHEGGWPIENGIKHQPTRDAVGGEFSKGQAEETDRLYNELMSNSFGGTRHTGIARMR